MVPTDINSHKANLNRHLGMAVTRSPGKTGSVGVMEGVMEGVTENSVNP